MKSVYAVHQGFELYGSDRVFIRSLHALRHDWPDAEFTVVLPAEGPLRETLVSAGFTVQIDDLWVLRRSLGLKLFNRLLRLPGSIWKAWRRGRAADLVYLSTTVILDHLLVAPFYKGAVLVHAHELPTGMAARILSGLLAWSRAAIVFISRATADAYTLPPSTVSRIVYNGYDGPVEASAPTPDEHRSVRLLMIGRINDWKGQNLLVEALSLLTEAERQRFDVRIVGDTFGGPASRDALVELIERHHLAYRVGIEGFQEDPSPLYEWSDIVIAPSRKPEPFGLIAIEAMSWARPVIAAAHGGLIEIVTGETGQLFEPNNAAALADALRAYAMAPQKTTIHGGHGRRRYETLFTGAAYTRNFNAFVRQIAKGEADGR